MAEPTIQIHPATITDLHRLRSTRDRETGGLLIGCRLAGLPVVMVYDIVETPDEYATESTWTLRAKGAQRLLEHRLRDEPVGSPIGYVGSWHTHPLRSPDPSPLDVETFTAECAKSLSYVAMVIVSAGQELTGMIGSYRAVPAPASVEDLDRYDGEE